MITPTLSQEKKLIKKGYRVIAGVDEVGRGSLAGPVMAAAIVIRNPEFKVLKRLVKDSKQLSARKREEVYEILKNFLQVKWGIGKVSEKVIDRINILEATKLAMKRAVINLERKLQKTTFCNLNFLILDGNIKVDLDIPQKSIKKADSKVFSVAASSIIAKVTRDRLMIRLHKKYPQYCFSQHKGYGTKLHFKMLKIHGPCKIHRYSFSPVKRA